MAAAAPDADLDALPRAGGAPACRARLRAMPEDFQVEEVLGFAPAGSGPHAWLKVRKRGLNSHEVARRIARLARVPVRQVGLAGLKDRHAVTTQWFSVLLEARPDPDWSGLEDPDIQVLEVTRHRHKLRRGVHRGNAFRLVLRDLGGPVADLAARVARVAADGAPNYFGTQRFGRDDANLDEARRLLAGEVRVKDRARRGILLSAARSHLFNRVLAARVTAGDWNRPVAGDVMNLDARHGLFLAAAADDAVTARAAAGEIHPTGPLWGRGGLRPQGPAGEREAAALAADGWWCGALEGLGLEMDRRPLRLMVRELGLHSDDAGTAVLTFRLRSGAYATTVLRELISAA